VKRASLIRAFLDQPTISSTLATNYWRVRVLDEVGSTQDELKHELVSNGECVVSEFQSAGRGRLDRKFESAPNVALLFSFYIEPKRLTQWGWITLIAGSAVASALNEVTKTLNFSTKWPNDVVSASGKIAGILCERYLEGIIVGIGVNVSTTVEELPVPTASSIFIETGIEFDRNQLLPRLLLSFEALFKRWESGMDITPTYRSLSQTIGREISVTLPDASTIYGRAIGVDIEGQLILENGDRINVGDIRHLR
jgi:BirA family biotin operon repressor/biotin-[acetyl-CoA-carboxylase] ligase